MSDGIGYCEIRKIEKIDTEEYDTISRVLNAIGNRNRIAMLAVISKYMEVCACELQPALGMPQPTITTHLHKMYDVGILKRKEVGKFSYYSINPKFEGIVNDILRGRTETMEA